MNTPILWISVALVAIGALIVFSGSTTVGISPISAGVALLGYVAFLEHKRRKGKPLLVSDRAREILSQRESGADRSCYPLEELLQSIDFNRAALDRKVWVYKWSGLVLLVLVPLISAALSALLGLNEGGLQTIFAITKDGGYRLTFWLGVALTFMTIMNSIFRPGERFRTACMIGIHVDHLVEDILGELETSDLSEDRLHTLVRGYREAMLPYQKDLIALFHPDAPGIRERDSHLQERERVLEAHAPSQT